MSIVSKALESEYKFSQQQNNFQWPEWSDNELNNEKWNFPRDGPDGFFLDPQPISMPEDLVPAKWIRPKDLTDLSEPLMVFAPGEQDLMTNNKHLFHSEFIRSFISTIVNLQECGKDGLEISGENENFTWIGRHQSWQGWMNVYGMNKIGKEAHQATINPIGKYIVRLFFMGSWRRVTVDDKVPVDIEGKPLLPRTSHKSELWPILLTKSLLKINTQMSNYHMVACLTGWTCLTLNIRHLSLQDKWDFLTKYAEHFEWQFEAKENERSSRTSTNNQNQEQEKISNILRVPEKPRPVTLFLRLENSKETVSRFVFNSQTLLSYFIYVSQFRDIPLDPKDMKPPLAKWKMYRWLNWAISEGIIDPEEYFTPIRYLKIVYPLRTSDTSDTDSIFNKMNYQDIATNENKKINGPEEEMGNETVERDPRDEIGRDLLTWSDFNKLGNRISEVYLFYKLEYFGYSMSISNTFPSAPRTDRKLKILRDDKKGSRRSTSFKEVPRNETEFVKSYFWPRETDREDPLYLFCDSLEEKFFLINFSGTPKSSQFSKIDGFGNSRKNRDYLFIQEDSWIYQLAEFNPLASISNSDNKSVVMELGPGRHLLRIFCSFESHYFITIASDTIFHVGNRLRMYKLMASESERIKEVAKHISDCVIKALESFGTDNYKQALKTYYKSYMPTIDTEKNKCGKLLCKKIHNYFINEEIRLIKQFFPVNEVEEISRSLRIFFIDPSIGLDRLDFVRNIIKSVEELKVNLNSSEEDPNLEKSLESCNSINYTTPAIRIQSFFKMLVIKKYKGIHNPNHKEHKEVQENLMKLASLFQHSQDESLVHRLLRNLLNRYEELQGLYPYFKDFEYTLEVQEFSGQIKNVKSEQWLPIARFRINSKPEETVFAGFDLFTNLRRYSLRVFNNENHEEMPKIVTKVSPAEYKRTNSGYTVIVYGWSTDEKLSHCDWTLNVITKKGEPLFQVLDSEEALTSAVNLPKITVQELSGVYIPNKMNRIAEWILEAPGKTVVSFRLKVSYHLVEMKLDILNEEYTVISTAEGKSEVVLPIVYLNPDKISRIDDWEAEVDHVKEDKRQKAYYIQAFVLNNSWPLTEAEWNTALEAKRKMTEYVAKTKIKNVSSSKTVRSDSSKMKRSSKYSVQSVHNLEAPFWTLQVVTDADSGIEIHEDTRRQKKLAELKESLFRDDPDRLRRGRELREAFLKKCTIESEVSESQESSTSSNASVFNLWGNIQGRKSEVRTLEPPDARRLRLPPVDPSIYVTKDDKKSIFLEDFKSYEDREEEEEEVYSLGIDDLCKDFQEKRHKLMECQKKRFIKLYEEYEDNYWKDRDLMEKLYEARKEHMPKSKPNTTTKTKRHSKTKKTQGVKK